MIWPHHLSVFYPYPNGVPFWQVTGAVFFLAVVSVLSLYWIKRRPYFLVGWLWYVGTLVPVSGLVQAGLWPEMADRWTYVPLIGLFIIVVWGMAECFDRWGLSKAVRAAFGLALLTALMAVTWIQLGYWQNSLTLFSHAAKVTPGSLPVYNNLGDALQREGRTAEAMVYFTEVIRAYPTYPDAYFNLANALVSLRRDTEAIEQYKEVLQLDPGHAKAHYNLGTVYQRRGELDQAIHHYSKALQADPNYAEAHNNMGSVLAMQGRAAEAISHFRAAIRIKPDYAGAHKNLKKVYQ
jgi:tetratricopeptide (TPR) repeat protein